MSTLTVEHSFAQIAKKEFDEDDRLGIRWRTQFAIALGVEPGEAYRLALGFAGIGVAAYEARAEQSMERRLARSYQP